MAASRYVISVDRTMGHRLGLRVDKEDGELFILEVQPGLVQEWNEANPDCQVGHATMGRVEECGGIHWKYNGSTMKYPFVGDKISKLSRKVIEKQGFILVVEFKHNMLSIIFGAGQGWRCPS